MKIIFVCHGNYCRSPMAEFIMKHKLAQAGINDVDVCSRAMHSDELGHDMYYPARRVLTVHGVPFSKHTATLMSGSDYDDADIVIVMDAYNRADAERRFGKEKVVMLMRAAGENKDVDDPWYTGDFERAYSDIDKATDALTKKLLSGVPRTVDGLFGR